MPQHPALTRATTFCEQFNLRVPILMAPMASACPPSLAIAIANAGGLGGCGALMLQPEAIRKWAADVRAGTNGGFQFNLWIPDPPPKRDAAAEAAVRDFLANWGPPVPPEGRQYCNARLRSAMRRIAGSKPRDRLVHHGPLSRPFRRATSRKLKRAWSGYSVWFPAWPMR